MPSGNLYGTSPNYLSNPFTSISNDMMPTNMRDLFDLCLWVYIHNPTFRVAVNRVANLFITNFEYNKIDEVGDTAVLKEYLEGCKDFKESLASIGIEYILNGNCFVYMYKPFKRVFKCTSCGIEFPADTTHDLKYTMEGLFECTCPTCNVKLTAMQCIEFAVKDLKKVKLIRINPKEMNIVYNNITGSSTFFWRLPSGIRAKYRNDTTGLLISETPATMLEAIFKDKTIKFSENELLHLKQPSISTADLEWGIPSALTSFPLVFYISVLRKANEAIAMDYILPLRVLYPQANTSVGDVGKISGSKFVKAINSIIATHREDPTTRHTSPFPLGYMSLGAEKKNLTIIRDLIESNKELLNSVGFPPELFNATLNVQSTPTALRLLENTFGLSDKYNIVLSWVVEQLCSYLGIGQTKVSMMPLRWADDIERRQMMVQLAMAGKISDSELLEFFGKDYEQTERKKYEQMNIQEKIQTEFMTKKQQQSSMQEQTGDVTQDIQAQAQELAAQLETMPHSAVRSQLTDLGKTDQVLHDATVGELERLRNRNKNMAYQQAKGQQ